MALRNDESPFEALCPELVERVLDMVVADKRSPLRELAQVNKTFREYARRCTRTLKLTSDSVKGVTGKTHKGWQVAELGFGKHDKAEVLFEALRSRPRLSTLVLEEGAYGGLWQALSKYAWSSVAVDHVDAEWYSFPPLSGSKFTLKTLSLGLKDRYNLRRDVFKDIQRILHAYPMLETLSLSNRGYLEFTAGPWRSQLQASKLSSLTFSGGHLNNWWDVFGVLPACSTALASLNFQCYYDHPAQARLPQPVRTLCSQFTRLQTIFLDVWTSHSARFVVESLTRLCRYLQHLEVFANPNTINIRTEYREPLRIWKIVESCPELEHLVVSQAEIVGSDGEFQKLALQHEVVSKETTSWNVSRSVLILNDNAIEAESSTSASSLKEIRLFRCIVAPYTSWVCLRRDDPRIKEYSLLGQDETVQSWCKCFSKNA